MDRGHGYDYDDDHDGDHDGDHGDDHGDNDGDDGDVDLVVLLRIGSCWMPTRMREGEVERTVGPLQTVHWS